MNEDQFRQDPGQASTVTALQAANDALRASENRYRHLIDSLRIGIVVSDASGVVRLANRLAEELTGGPEQRWVNREIASDTRPWFDKDGRRLDPVEYPINRAQRERRAIRGEIVGFDNERTGTRTWLMVDTEPEFDARGEVDRVITSFTNITDHIDGEQQRQALALAVSETRRLESLGILAGGVAHDFNNLLTGVLANAELALHELPPDAPARASVQQIIAAAERATTLARRMLAYSGRASVALGTVDLNALVQDVAALIRPSIATRVAIEQALDPAVPPALADPAQLADLLTNLLTNAADAIGTAEGHITISTGMVEATPEYFANSYLAPQLPPGLYAFFEVADDGEGIPEAARGRVFEPFFTTRFTGRGLGLSAAVGLVRSGHGAVQVDSAPGEGARFRVTVPLATASGTIGGPTGTSTAAVSGGVVLIADDEDTVLSVASRALERAGYQPLPARNGREAVDLFGLHRDEITAVVLDVTMPGLDGREALGLMRLIAPRIPAVIMSGYALADLGFDEPNINAVFLQKPFVIAELHAAVRAAIEGARA